MDLDLDLSLGRNTSVRTVAVSVRCIIGHGVSLVNLISKKYVSGTNNLSSHKYSATLFCFD